MITNYQLLSILAAKAFNLIEYDGDFSNVFIEQSVSSKPNIAYEQTYIALKPSQQATSKRSASDKQICKKYLDTN